MRTLAHNVRWTQLATKLPAPCCRFRPERLERTNVPNADRNRGMKRTSKPVAISHLSGRLRYDTHSLTTWFGVDSANLATVFPNLGRFSTSNLGFV